MARPTSTEETEILTIKQVAGYLQVTERTIYRLAAAEGIPAFKVGGSWRFRRGDLDQWIAGSIGRTGAPPETERPK
ncbi:helix-turn-helix domain-containing protein [Xanthomonas phaseoli]|uniref:helix-turn-helix domain-containing protein n=1 Tax=Xanthomonas phaseoli TaxID=1985254 RepID=UPI00035E9004|nr:helix-turn-helix domain-containing protein [Xanthomonas phaseoli]